MGLLSWKKGKLKKSKNYFKKSFLLMEAVGNPPRHGQFLVGPGTRYTSEGNLNKAFSYLEKSLSTFQKMRTKSKTCQN
ncbi:MAG: hypothetical protein QGG48_00715, partial [Desulfatiglandales bacterium]|nr:hypothetical protein [Desulfatiglandales bacterium]